MSLETLVLDPFTKAATTEISKYLFGYLNEKIQKVYKSKKANSPDQKELAQKFSNYLEKSYTEYSTIPTLALKERKTSLHDIYHPLILKEVRPNNLKNSNVHKLLNYDEEFFKNNPKLIITDNAGMGKSTFLKFLFLSAMQQRIQIPIFIELRHLKVEHSILDEMYKKINYLNKDFNQEQILELVKDGDFLFFLDGYDEIPLIDREKVSKELKQFMVHGDKNRFIITSRPDEGLNLSNFEKYEIRKLEPEEAFSIIKKYDDATGYNLQEELIETIKKSQDHFQQFIQNPMFVSLLYLTYRNKRELPLTQSSFYRTVYDALYSDHDLTKDDGFKRDKLSDLTRDDLEFFFQKFAYYCFVKDVNDFEFDALLNIIKEILKDNYFQDKYEAYHVFKDITKNVPLIVKDGLNYKWIHKSFMEYFSAKYISIHQNKVKILESLSRRGLSHYLNILKIYNDIDRDTFDNLLVKPLLEEFIQYVEKEEVSGEILGLREWTFANQFIVTNIRKETKHKMLRDEGFSEEDIQKEIEKIKQQKEEMQEKNVKNERIEKLTIQCAFELLHEKIGTENHDRTVFISPNTLTSGISDEDMLKEDTYLIAAGRYNNKPENFYTIIEILSSKKYPIFKQTQPFLNGKLKYSGFKELDLFEDKFLWLDNKKLFKEITKDIEGLHESFQILHEDCMDYSAVKNYLNQINKQNEDLLDFWNEQ